MVNSHLVCDPTIRQPGFDLPWQQWSLLNRFRTEQGHCGACRRKWRLTDTDLCPCGETQRMSDIVKSCPLTKLNGGLSRLHSADEDAVSWLTSYGSWNAYEKKKKYTMWLLISTFVCDSHTGVCILEIYACKMCDRWQNLHIYKKWKIPEWKLAGSFRNIVWEVLLLIKYLQENCSVYFFCYTVYVLLRLRMMTLVMMSRMLQSRNCCRRWWKKSNNASVAPPRHNNNNNT